MFISTFADQILVGYSWSSNSNPQLRNPLVLLKEISRTSEEILLLTGTGPRLNRRLPQYYRWTQCSAYFRKRKFGATFISKGKRWGDSQSPWSLNLAVIETPSLPWRPKHLTPLPLATLHLPPITHCTPFIVRSNPLPQTSTTYHLYTPDSAIYILPIWRPPVTTPINPIASALLIGIAWPHCPATEKREAILNWIVLLRLDYFVGTFARQIE